MQDAYKEIAPRLRGLRDALDLSAAKLAEMVGVTEEMVARYESGTEEIPVGFLMNVANACGVDLPVLISGDEAHLTQYSLVRKGQGLSVDRRKSYDYKNLAFRFKGSRMEPFLVTVPSKGEDALSWSEHPGQEFIYMLEGELEIRLQDKALALKPGDSLYFNSRTPHALRGLNGEPAVFLDVIIQETVNGPTSAGHSQSETHENPGCDPAAHLGGQDSPAEAGSRFQAPQGGFT